jgi:sulfane dehydrogenase subunit SoxC
VITRPAGGQKMAGSAGAYEITGLAWSGRGKIQRVEVSTDGGKSWKDAELQLGGFAKAFTRFRLPWVWDGGAASLQSRATDETGYTQPTRDALIAIRGMTQGPDGFNHYHGIKPWHVDREGKVTHV